MHVLILNQAFSPDVAATAQHCHDLSVHLVRQGHRVTVIASRSVYGQAGAAFPKRETVDGIDVIRVGAAKFGKRNMFLRLLDYNLFFVRVVLRSLLVSRPDVVIGLTTPPFIVLAGVLLRILRRSRCIYWVMDLYPDIPVAMGLIPGDGLLARFFEKLNRWCMHRSDRVVVLGRCMEERVLQKGIPARQVTRIGPWPAHVPAQQDREAGPDNPFRREWNLNRKFVVMYSGNLGLAHDAQTFLEATRKLAGHDHIRFVFVGGGKRMTGLNHYLARHNLTNVQVHPYQPRSRLGELLSMPDVHLISQLDSFVGMVVPSKLYGIMAAGRPAIFVGPEAAEVARQIKDSDCGQTIPVGQADALCATIERLADDRQQCQATGRHALKAAMEEHNVEMRCATWEKLLLEVTSRRHQAADKHRSVDTR